MVDAGKAGPTSLSNEQLQTLIAMLNNQQINSNDKMTGKHNKISSIIYTGTSNHIVGCLKILHNVRKIPRCPITFPDGSSVIATHEGLTKLGGNLV